MFKMFLFRKIVTAFILPLPACLLLAAIGLMKFDERADIDVADSIAIGHQKCTVNVVSDPPNTTACLSVLARIDERDTPFFAWP